MVQSGTVDVMLSLSLPLFCLSLSHTHTINSRSCCFSPHPNCPVGGGRIIPLSLLNLAFSQVSIRSSAVNGDMAALTKAGLSSPRPRSLRSLSLND